MPVAFTSPLSCPTPPRIEPPMLMLLMLRLLRICPDRKSTRLNSSHQIISYAVFCLKKKKEVGQESKRVTAAVAELAPTKVALSCILNRESHKQNCISVHAATYDRMGKYLLTLSQQL